MAFIFTSAGRSNRRCLSQPKLCGFRWSRHKEAEGTSSEKRSWNETQIAADRKSRQHEDVADKSRD